MHSDSVRLPSNIPMIKVLPQTRNVCKSESTVALTMDMNKNVRCHIHKQIEKAKSMNREWRVVGQG